MGRQVAVIGGGAAGMTAAIWAARGGAFVTVYERNDRVGRKLLSTGNGKCNFSNEDVDAEAYYGGGAELATHLFAEFGVPETKRFFTELGMRIKVKEGRLYPASEQASTVLDVLRFELERLGVTVHTQCRVTDLNKKNKKIVVAADGKEREYDAAVLACGGRAAPKTGTDGAGFALSEKLGHSIVPTVPALGALRCEGGFWKGVAGVRCEAELTLLVEGRVCQKERGELQLADYGISGIPVFQLSRNAAYALLEKRHTAVEIDFMAEYTEDEYRQFWDRRFTRQSEQAMERFLTGIVNKKINMLMLRTAGIKPTEKARQITELQKRKLESLYRAFRAEVRETNSYDQAQVCAGGVNCLELTGQLESRIAPGVYFAGEIVDIDGRCGGYNLQWAWTSGAVAGRAAAGCGAQRGE